MIHKLVNELKILQTKHTIFIFQTQPLLMHGISELCITTTDWLKAIWVLEISLMLGNKSQ
jgi:hypothetical protein